MLFVWLVTTLFTNNKKHASKVCCVKIMFYLCRANLTLQPAQMAELVDALVSNTNVERRAGSIPALGTESESSSEGSDFFVSWFA